MEYKKVDKQQKTAVFAMCGTLVAMVASVEYVLYKVSSEVMYGFAVVPY